MIFTTEFNLTDGQVAEIKAFHTLLNSPKAAPKARPSVVPPKARGQVAKQVDKLRAERGYLDDLAAQHAATVAEAANAAKVHAEAQAAVKLAVEEAAAKAAELANMPAEYETSRREVAKRIRGLLAGRYDQFTTWLPAELHAVLVRTPGLDPIEADSRLDKLEAIDWMATAERFRSGFRFAYIVDGGIRAAA